MTIHDRISFDRRAFLKASGILAIGFSMSGLPGPAGATTLRAPKSVAKEAIDSWLTISPDNRVTIFCGKVDLGTGARTALAQMAAEELDVSFDRIEMVMGDTATTPDQWLTAGNLTIFQGGSELRRAAASARRALVERAAQRLGVPASELIVEDGVVRVKANPERALRYGELIGDGAEARGRYQDRAEEGARLQGDRQVDPARRHSGQGDRRIHLHPRRSPAGHAARPRDPARRSRCAHRIRRRLGGTPGRRVRADRAQGRFPRRRRPQRMGGDQGGGSDARDLDCRHGPARSGDRLRQLGASARSRRRKSPRTSATRRPPWSGSAQRIKATYDFAVQTHATIGPSCAVADFQGGKLTVWTSSQATHSMQHELAVITGLSREAIRLVFIEGAGCYGRNGTEDAAADAALIAMLIGQPVRVQWSRADETARSPKSPPRTMDMEAGLDAQGNVVAWTGDFYIALNHIAAFKPLDFPLLAATETGIPRPGNWVGFLFQNSGQPYQFPNIRVNTRHIAEAFFRSSHLRSPGRIENSFANEGFMDELAVAANADPAEYRLRYLKDQRAIDVLQAAMKLANWQARPGPNPNAGSGPVVKGRGIAYLRYNNAITYVAAVAEVEVNKDTGEIRVTRVCASHDCGEMVNPDGVANQVEGGVLQTVSRTLMETVTWDRNKVTSVDWASYPIMRHTQAPKVEIALIDRPGTVAWGAGEPMACAIPAAIANAVFDATGARLRSVPFTPDKVKAALAGIQEQRG